MVRRLGLASLAAAVVCVAAPASGAHATSAAPKALNFGSQKVGTTTATQAVLLSACSLGGSGTGCTSSTFSGVFYNSFTNECPNASGAFAGSCRVSNEFSQTSDCPSSLAPGQRCTIQVRFKPTVAGTQTATLYTGTDNFPTSLTPGDKVFVVGIGRKSSSKKCRKKPGRKNLRKFRRCKKKKRRR